MLCCDGQTYIVNEPSEVPGSVRPRKDSSFKSLITFLLVQIVIYLVVYCLILSITKVKEADLKETEHLLSNSSTEQQNGEGFNKSTTAAFNESFGRPNDFTKVKIPHTKDVRENINASNANKIEYTTNKHDGTTHYNINGTKAVVSTTQKSSNQENESSTDKEGAQIPTNITSAVAFTETTLAQNSFTTNNIQYTKEVSRSITDTTFYYVTTNAKVNENKVVVNVTPRTTSQETTFLTQKEATEIHANTTLTTTVSQEISPSINKLKNSTSNKLERQFSAHEATTIITIPSISDERKSSNDQPKNKIITTTGFIETTSNISEEKKPSTDRTRNQADAETTTNFGDITSKENEPLTDKSNYQATIKTVEATTVETTSSIKKDFSTDIPEEQVEAVDTTTNSDDITSKESKPLTDKSNYQATTKTVATTTDETTSSTTETELKHVKEFDRTADQKENQEFPKTTNRASETTTQRIFDYVNTHTETTVATTKVAELVTTTNTRNNVKRPVESSTASNPEQDTQKTKNLFRCTSSECKSQAADILQRLDHSTDRCEGFYQFACGRAQMTDNSADDLVKILYDLSPNNDNQLKSFQTFFNSCLHYDQTHGVFAKVQQVLTSNIRAYDLTNLLVFLMQRQTVPLFEVNVVNTNEEFILQILPPSDFYDNAILKPWSLESHIREKCSQDAQEFKYEKRIELPLVYKTFKNCQEKTLKQLVKDFALFVNGKMYNNINTKDTVMVVEFLEFFLNKTQISEIDIQDALLKNKFNTLTVGELSEKYPIPINWKNLFSKLTGRTIQESTTVSIYFEEEYFYKLMRNLSRIKLEEAIQIIKLYYQLQLHENLMAHEKNSHNLCLNQAVSLMPEIAENIFQQNPRILKEKENIRQIFHQINNSSYNLISISSMDQNLKNSLNQKLGVLSLSFSNGTKNAFLEDHHNYITNDYLSNLFYLLESKRKESIERGDFNTRRYGELPEHISNTDLIAIPNAFLHKITHDKNKPLYLSEAYIKFYLARAIGLYLNQPVWDIDFLKQFQTSLNAYWENNDRPKSLNGHEVLHTKNIANWTDIIKSSSVHRAAENMALQIAFQSSFPITSDTEVLPWISDNYTSPQQFFILIAQEYCDSAKFSKWARDLYETPHMPDAFRVDAMMANSEYFQEAFRCADGSDMNPVEKTIFDKFIEESQYEEANK